VFFPLFAGPEGLLPCSEERSTRSYPEPDESAHIVRPVSLRYILLLRSHLCLCQQICISFRLSDKLEIVLSPIHAIYHRII